MSGQTTILDRAWRCMVLFNQLLAAVDKNTTTELESGPSALINDQVGRFRIWAGNIGLYADASASLDYRVQDIPQIKNLIVQQLDGLGRYLQRAIKVIQPEAKYSAPHMNEANDARGEEDLSTSSSTSISSDSDMMEYQIDSSSQSPLREEIKNIEKTITRMYRLSVAIRKSSSQGRKKKAANYIDRDESGHDMSSEFQKFATTLIKQKYPDISEALCERLGCANSLRRRQFLYRQRHEQKLSLGANSRPPNKVTALKLEHPVPNQDFLDGGHTPSKNPQSRHITTQKDRQSTPLSHTVASTLEIHSFQPGAALSKVSTAITASPLQGSFDVPPPPKLNAGAKEFQCPYCFMILPAKFASISRWRNHVKKDLEPYVCMFEECAEPRRLFSTTADWISHMQREHTLQWRCNAPGHLPQVFGKEQDFEDHMWSSHAGTFTESQLPVLKRRSIQPAAQTFLSCPLCSYLPSESLSPNVSGVSSEDLSTHVAAHLQSIALVSLPWREDLDEDASSNRTSAPGARDSILDLKDNISVLSFDDTPHNTTSDTEIDDVGRSEGSDERKSRNHEWEFIVLPPYEGHTADPILKGFVINVEWGPIRALSAGMQNLVHSIRWITTHLRKIINSSELNAKLFRELQITANTLQGLQSRLDASRPEDSWLEGFFRKAKLGGTLLADGHIRPDGTLGIDGPFAQLEACLHKVVEEVIPQSDIQNLTQTRSWLSDSDQLSNFTSQLSALQQQINSIIDTYIPYVSRETSSLNAAEYWSPLDFSTRHLQILMDSFGSGSWFFESQEFKSWVSGRPWTLHIYGNPKVGKTVLSSLVVDHLQEISRDQNIAVLCMYLSSEESETQTLENLIGSLIRQLLQYHSSMFQSADVAKLELDVENRVHRPKLQDIISVLRSEIKKFQRVYLIVDGLNECEEPIRQELEFQLKDVRSEKLSVMVTSRHTDMPGIIIDCDMCRRKNLRIYHHCQICDDGNFDVCQDCVDKGRLCKDASHVLSEPYSAVEIEMVTPDLEIQQFASYQLNGRPWKGRRDVKSSTARLARELGQDQQLKDLICTTIVDKAKGSFFVARLFIDALEQQHTSDEIRSLIQKPLRTLESYYKKVVERIHAQPEKDRALAKTVFSLIVFAKRPLNYNEFHEAINFISRGERYKPDASYEFAELLLSLSDNYKPDISYGFGKILSVTAGLVTVDQNSTVCFFDQTAREYFNAEAEKWIRTAEADIALAIMSYTRMETILYSHCENDKDFADRRNRHPFFFYSAAYWGDHVRPVIHKPTVRAATLQFVRNPANLAPCLRAQRYGVARGSIEEGHRGTPNSLHECARFGLAPLIPDLLDDGIDIDTRDSNHGLTALMYACKRGHAETVKILLKFDASVNILSRKGSSSIFEAIYGAHLDVVKLLVEKKELEINATNPGDLHRTALMIAADRGATRFVRCLLQRADIEVNKKDETGATALVLAAEKGHDATVSLLLFYENIEVNAVKENGVSALIVAAEGGFDTIARQLLGYGADASVLYGPFGFAAITLAVIKGYLSVVKTMESYGADFNILDDRGRSLLHHASRKGHSEIVQYLHLKGLKPNTQCGRGGTALHYAARSSQREVIRVLLELGADPSIQDYSGGTPVVVAWQNGQTKAARAIQGQAKSSDVEEGIPTEIAKTLPLWSLAKLNMMDLLASRLSQVTDLEMKNPYTNNSAVHLATAYHNNEILEMLLDAKASPNCQNDDGSTPLHLAVSGENTKAVSLLLQHKAQVDPLDKFGLTPIQLALRITLSSGHLDCTIAIWIIDAGLSMNKDNRFDLQKKFIQPLLFAAIKMGNARVLEFLMEEGVDILAKDVDGYTALQLAEKAGFDDVTETLKTRMKFYQYQKRPRQLALSE